MLATLEGIDVDAPVELLGKRKKFGRKALKNIKKVAKSKAFKVAAVTGGVGVTAYAANKLRKKVMGKNKSTATPIEEVDSSIVTPEDVSAASSTDAISTSNTEEQTRTAIPAQAVQALVTAGNEGQAVDDAQAQAEEAEAQAETRAREDVANDTTPQGEEEETLNGDYLGKFSIKKVAKKAKKLAVKAAKNKNIQKAALVAAGVGAGVGATLAVQKASTMLSSKKSSLLDLASTTGEAEQISKMKDAFDKAIASKAVSSETPIVSTSATQYTKTTPKSTATTKSMSLASIPLPVKIVAGGIAATLIIKMVMGRQ